MIKLIWCLCPRRHGVFVAAYDTDGFTDEEAMERTRRRIDDLLREGQIDPWCELCGATRFHLEVEVTRYRTQPEAEAALRDALRDGADARARLQRYLAEAQ